MQTSKKLLTDPIELMQERARVEATLPQLFNNVEVAQQAMESALVRSELLRLGVDAHLGDIIKYFDRTFRRWEKARVIGVDEHNVLLLRTICKQNGESLRPRRVMRPDEIGLLRSDADLERTKPKKMINRVAVGWVAQLHDGLFPLQRIVISISPEAAETAGLVKGDKVVGTPDESAKTLLLKKFNEGDSFDPNNTPVMVTRFVDQKDLKVLFQFKCEVPQKRPTAPVRWSSPGLGQLLLEDFEFVVPFVRRTPREAQFYIARSWRKRAKAAAEEKIQKS